MIIGLGRVVVVEVLAYLAPVFWLRVSRKRVVDLVQRVVILAGHKVQSTLTECDLLKLLVSQAGKVVTQRQILQQVWGGDYEHKAHLLRVNVSNLRRKLEPDPSRPTYIVTEPGVGYRLRLDR